MAAGVDQEEAGRLVVLFGRTGIITTFLDNWLNIPRSRWIYGLPGVLIAQLLAFTPIAFLVLIGVVQGISPSLEEASRRVVRPSELDRGQWSRPSWNEEAWPCS
jgi:ABC-type molybdate transport system permease subunit